MTTTPPCPTVTVRSYRGNDHAQLCALWSTVFGDADPATMIAKKLEVQPELLLVAEASDALVGSVIAGYDGVRGWIYHLAVTPNWRRRGIASLLVARAEADLVKLGCPKINLQVRVENQQVVAFYRSLGYLLEERVSMGKRTA